jgi:hypothetical protein
MLPVLEGHWFLHEEHAQELLDVADTTRDLWRVPGREGFAAGTHLVNMHSQLRV